MLAFIAEAASRRAAPATSSFALAAAAAARAPAELSRRSASCRSRRSICSSRARCSSARPSASWASCAARASGGGGGSPRRAVPQIGELPVEAIDLLVESPLLLGQAQRFVGELRGARLIGRVGVGFLARDAAPLVFQSRKTCAR